ncbi:MAG: 50S ribosomal protein L32 [Candidatus Magasanikbacteria bacterium CG10_big_fil_rev_8_21_14_0_10_43_6]|uniref:Large ribosomal subunit protein bL32 n=1 Tax=Candidatus Magasanikbacteria bacterium CG10_big_fil_rev_8_21_14_0_10_43_6 TaxID=1974650 RepID=A0A2M6W0A9_9BACT|nr:MAG: 50S ribosomal protein L32 [Candidatus Magasanikbacteria bacterium CG10_big_fil_rev_8_21_14_0_10_43_6]
MGLPSQKRTNTSKKQRASHFALKTVNTIKCESCGAKTMPHKACVDCGSYKGNEVDGSTKRNARRAKRIRKIS